MHEAFKIEIKKLANIFSLRIKDLKIWITLKKQFVISTYKIPL